MADESDVPNTLQTEENPQAYFQPQTSAQRAAHMSEGGFRCVALVRGPSPTLRLRSPPTSLPWESVGPAKPGHGTERAFPGQRHGGAHAQPEERVPLRRDEKGNGIREGFPTAGQCDPVMTLPSRRGSCTQLRFWRAQHRATPSANARPIPPSPECNTTGTATQDHTSRLPSSPARGWAARLSRDVPGCRTTRAHWKGTRWRLEARLSHRGGGHPPPHASVDPPLAVGPGLSPGLEG